MTEEKTTDEKFIWEDVTDYFSERRRHWNGRYLELDEVAFEQIECSLFSCPYDRWEIFVKYGIMEGVSYVPAEKAQAQRKQMMKEIEEEYARNGFEPSDEFINSFARKYRLSVL